MLHVFRSLCSVPPNRKAWISLGTMSREEARQSLIKLLDAATPLLNDTVLDKWRTEQRCGVTHVYSTYMHVYIYICTYMYNNIIIGLTV